MSAVSSADSASTPSWWPRVPISSSFAGRVSRLNSLLARAGLLTAIIWVMLTLTLKQGGHSLWELVRLVPGATAIRCVSRVYVIVYLFGTLAALMWLGRIADPLRPAVRLTLFIAIAIA